MLGVFLQIVEKIPVNALLLMSATSVILGDYFAKTWSLQQRPGLFVLAVFGYIFSGLFYIPTLLRENLVITSIIWSIFSIVGFLVIGLFIFHETLTPLQTIGIILGISALILLNL